ESMTLPSFTRQRATCVILSGRPNALHPASAWQTCTSRAYSDCRLDCFLVRGDLALLARHLFVGAFPSGKRRGSPTVLESCSIETFAPRRFASRMLAPDRSVQDRSAPDRSAPDRLVDCISSWNCVLPV